MRTKSGDFAGCVQIFLMMVVFRYILHAGHLHLQIRRCGYCGHPRHSRTDTIATSLLHPNAGPVHILPPGPDRVRHDEGPPAVRRPDGFRSGGRRRLRLGS